MQRGGEGEDEGQEKGNGKAGDERARAPCQGDRHEDGSLHIDRL